MGLACFDNVHVRDANAEDVTALTRLKPAEAVHRDRLQDALSPRFRYMVLERAGDVIGFACLVFVRPRAWSDAHDTSHLPQLVDVQIAPALRGRGYGTYLIGALEQIAAASRAGEVFLAVDPINNPRAYALYQRLGFREFSSRTALVRAFDDAPPDAGAIPT